MKTLNIMQIVHSMGTAGAEKVVYDIVNNLKGDKFSFSICCLDFIGDLGKQLIDKGIEVFSLDRKPGVDFKLINRLKRILKEQEVDIIHAHQYTPYFYGATAKALSGKCKVIFTEHGRHQPDKVRLKRVIYNQFLNFYTDKITGVSEFSKDSLVKYEKLPAAKIEVIYNGIDPEKYNEANDKKEKRKELGITKENETLVAMVGRFSPIKNHKMLLAAFKDVLKEAPDTKLALIGDGSLKKECEQLASRLGIQDHILFTGKRENVPELLPAFDICVLSSNAEAASIFLLEAMAAGRPVIATEAGGNPEIVLQDQTGLLVPPKDPVKFAEAMMKLIQNPEKREKMGEAGRERLKSLFNLNKMLKGYEDLYLNLAYGGNK